MQERCVFAHYCAAHAMLHAFIEAADWERGQGLLDNHGRMPQKLFLPFGDVLNVGDGLLRAKSAKLVDTHISEHWVLLNGSSYSTINVVQHMSYH